MGCWSESCAISGLEISDQTEALVMLLQFNEEPGYSCHGAYSRYQPMCLPTWGKYSDYGDIEDVASCDPLYFTMWLEKARRKIDPNEDSHTDYMSKMWWVRKDVWDFCDTIPHEFSYGDNPKTIGESCQRMRDKLYAHVKSEREEMALDLHKDGFDPDSAIAQALRRMRSSDHNIFGLRSYEVNIIQNLQNELEDAIENNDQPKIDNSIEGIVRLNKIAMICHELRKLVTPSTFTGPQHGGYEAASLLATFTLTKCGEYFSRSNDD